jgi:hypothetical protein
VQGTWQHGTQLLQLLLLLREQACMSLKPGTSRSQLHSVQVQGSLTVTALAGCKTIPELGYAGLLELHLGGLLQVGR